MAHFAEINADGIVQRVIVAEQDFINSGAVGNPANWIQTSYNTQGGENKTGGKALRKNFAGVGYTYDKNRDAFIAPKAHDSWKLDEETCQWVAPIPMPDDQKPYSWNEEKLNWVEEKP